MPCFYSATHLFIYTYIYIYVAEKLKIALHPFLRFSRIPHTLFEPLIYIYILNSTAHCPCFNLLVTRLYIYIFQYIHTQFNCFPVSTGHLYRYTYIPTYKRERVVGWEFSSPHYYIWLSPLAIFNPPIYGFIYVHTVERESEALKPKRKYDY